MEPSYCAESYQFWQTLRLGKDRDPRNRTSGLRIRILLLLFLQWLSRFKQEIGWFSTFIFLFLSVVKFTSVFNDNNLFWSHKAVEIKVFIIFLLVDGRIRIRTNNYGSGFGTLLWTECIMFLFWKADSGSKLVSECFVLLPVSVRYSYGYFLLLLQVADLFGSAERHVFQKFGSDLRLSTLEAAMGKQQEDPSPVQQASSLTVSRIRDFLEPRFVLLFLLDHRRIRIRTSY